MNEDEVVEDLREEREQFGQLWRQLLRAERDANAWISEGADCWEETLMLAELKSELDDARRQPTRILKALRASRVSLEKAEALKMTLCSKRSDLEQSLEAIQVPSIRSYDAQKRRELMSDG
jgi:hypothetical protein